MSTCRAITELAGKFAASAREAEQGGHHGRAAELYKTALIMLAGLDLPPGCEPASGPPSKDVDAS